MVRPQSFSSTGFLFRPGARRARSTPKVGRALPFHQPHQQPQGQHIMDEFNTYQAIVGTIVRLHAPNFEHTRCMECEQNWPCKTVALVKSRPDSPYVEATESQNAKILGSVLGQIDARLPSIIATNTSAMSINELAKCVKDPSSFLGMHFFNPVWSLAMVELIRGDATSASTLAMAQSYSDSIGKTSITVRDVPGFATSRLDLIASLEAMRMLN